MQGTFLIQFIKYYFIHPKILLGKKYHLNASNKKMSTEIKFLNNDLSSKSVAYYCLSDEVITIQKEINMIYSDYSFYPEVEWDNYGYYPPEGHQVLGAWRHTELKAFVFLLDNPSMYILKSHKQLILFITGDKKEVLRKLTKCAKLQEKRDNLDKHRLLMDQIDRNLHQIYKTKSIKVISTILVSFTAIINVFSLYLRKLSTPKMIPFFTETYNYLITLIHISSLVLLCCCIIFLIIFLVKYGMTIIKRF